MVSDYDLDVRLAAAAGVRDEDLPALPDSFLRDLRDDVDHGAEPAPVSEGEPASVVAARQLVTDAHKARTTPDRLWPRRPARRSITVLATAAVGAAVLVVGLTQVGTWSDPDVTAAPTTTSPATVDSSAPTGPPADLGPLEAPPGGLALAAIEAISFPYSLDPEPAGLTPVLSLFGGVGPLGTEPTSWGATYQAADDPGFTFVVRTEDPRILPEGAFEDPDATITETTTLDVDGLQADLVRGDYNSPSCSYAPSSPEQSETPDELCAESFAELTWQRPDGLWVQVRGEDRWSTTETVVSVGESIADRPQAVPLQIRVAPAGWSVASYDSNSGLTLISDTEPTFANQLTIQLQERWRGNTAPDLQEGTTQGNPVQQVTVNGQPAELVSVPADSSMDPDGPRMWVMEAQLPDGPVFYFQAPDTLTQDQVLQIAAQVTYNP